MKIAKLFLCMICTVLCSFAYGQLKKDGTPDMRYSANKQTYGNTYSAPVTYSSASTSVRYQNGYVKSDGVYVQPHMKTNINSTNHDNMSTSGNTNIYNGTTGSRAKDYSSDAYNYGSGKAINTGERGGQYYFNSKGNKVYVPKR